MLHLEIQPEQQPGLKEAPKFVTDANEERRKMLANQEDREAQELEVSAAAARLEIARKATGILRDVAIRSIIDATEVPPHDPSRDVTPTTQLYRPDAKL